MPAAIIVYALMTIAVANEQHSVEARVGQHLESMTVEEKVGQLIMIGFGGTTVNDEIRLWLSERKVGGAVLFSRNIVDLAQTAQLTRGILELNSGIPAFIALDQEGGNVVRVKDGATVLPGNMTLGATRSPMLSMVSGQSMGIDLRRLGFNMNLAPVLDINSNPRNPVIGVRSFGEEAKLVGQLGAWFIRGQQEVGVSSVAKHFPGHGDTHSDSHFSMPAISADEKRLFEIELEPFVSSISAGVDALMTAHIAIPKVLEAPDLPATLSKRLLTDILRKRLGFEGIVITDGLEMQGIVKKYGSGEAAVRAILAGADMAMILWTQSKKEEVYNALLEAVASGRLSQERLDASVRRILRVKYRRGLFDSVETSLAEVIEDQNYNALHRRVSSEVARAGLTLVRNRGEMLPLNPTRYKKVVVMAPPGPLASRLEKEPNIEVVKIPWRTSRALRKRITDRIVKSSEEADALVFAVVNRSHVSVVQNVLRRAGQIPSAMVSLASPYFLEYVPQIDAYVCAYSYQPVAQDAVADGLLGSLPMHGRLPVSLPGYYEAGHRANDGVRAALSP